MSTNLKGEVSTMYRNRGQARDNARKTITRETHGVVLSLHHNGVPTQHADWHYDLRRGRLCIYGGLLRFIDQTIDAGRDDLADEIVEWLRWYVADSKDPSGTAHPLPVRKAA